VVEAHWLVCKSKVRLSIRREICRFQKNLFWFFLLSKLLENFLSELVNSLIKKITKKHEKNLTDQLEKTSKTDFSLKQPKKCFNLL